MAFLQADDRISGLKEAKATKVAKVEKPIVDKYMFQVRKTLHEKFKDMKGFLKLEVIQVGSERYRANIVFQKYTEGHLIPLNSRPYSTYITVVNEKLVFNPAI